MASTLLRFPAARAGCSIAQQDEPTGFSPLLSLNIDPSIRARHPLAYAILSVANDNLPARVEGFLGPRRNR